MNLRVALKSKIDSITVWFTIVGISIFFVFWVYKLENKIDAIYESTVVEQNELMS